MFLFIILVLISVAVFAATFRISKQLKILIPYISVLVALIIISEIYNYVNHHYCLGNPLQHVGYGVQHRQFCNGQTFRLLYDAPGFMYIATVVVGIVTSVVGLMRRLRQNQHSES